MTEVDLLARITTDPALFGGKPLIRGMRLAVEHVLGMHAAGESSERVLEEYPFLEWEDILACLAYACRSIVGEAIYDRVPRVWAS